LANAQGAGDTAGWLIEEWTSKLASAVELMTEAPPGLKLGGRILANSAEVPAGVLWHSVPLDFAADAAVFIGAPQETWLHIGRSALLAAGVTDIATEDARGTYLEIITQATSGLAQTVAERLGRAVASLPAKEIKFGGDGLSDAIGVNPVEISLREPPLRKLYVGWSHALELALAPMKAKEEERPEPDRAETKQGALPEKSTTLDLLMEVELPVSVSFGRAQLPLRDVLKLNSGSIVELNRTISDPVEIIVNNCVIARGEVVVVEGNYGVRIQHVISREERLRTLK
jgi:flagellar motor switch protein FliN